MSRPGGRGRRCAGAAAPPPVARMSRRRTRSRGAGAPASAAGCGRIGQVARLYDARQAAGAAETCHRRPGAAAPGQKCCRPAGACSGLAWSWAPSAPLSDPRRRATRPQVPPAPSPTLRGSLPTSLPTSILNSLAPSLLPFLLPSILPPLPPSHPPTHPPSFPPSLFFLSLPHPGLRPWPKPNPPTPDWGFFCAPTPTLPGLGGWAVKVLGPALDLWVP